METWRVLPATINHWHPGRERSKVEWRDLVWDWKRGIHRYNRTSQVVKTGTRTHKHTDTKKITCITAGSRWIERQYSDSVVSWVYLAFRIFCTYGFQCESIRPLLVIKNSLNRASIPAEWSADQFRSVGYSSCIASRFYCPCFLRRRISHQIAGRIVDTILRRFDPIEC